MRLFSGQICAADVLSEPVHGTRVTFHLDEFHCGISYSPAPPLSMMAVEAIRNRAQTETDLGAMFGVDAPASYLKVEG